MYEKVFRRQEIKYLLSPETHRALMQIIEPYLRQDRYFHGTNCSVYLDTPSRDLAIKSLEKPLYKEKVRVRSYGVPTLDDTVFVEIKKKFRGIGSKRRIGVKLRDWYTYLGGQPLPTDHPQIAAELDYTLNYHGLQPALFIAYDRYAYVDEDNPAFRLTFDHRIRYRTDRLQLERGDAGTPYFNDDTVLMEVKALDAYPLWFVRALSKLRIHPASFSKYNKITQQIITKEKSHV